MERRRVVREDLVDEHGQDFRGARTFLRSILGRGRALCSDVVAATDDGMSEAAQVVRPPRRRQTIVAARHVRAAHVTVALYVSRGHQLPSKQVTLTVVAEKNEVVLLVQPEEQVEGRVLGLANRAPRLRLPATHGGDHRHDAVAESARKERGKAMQLLVDDEPPEEPVALVFEHVLVEMGPGGQEDEVATRPSKLHEASVHVVRNIPGAEDWFVKDVVEGQTSRINHVGWELRVATSREGAATGVHRIVNVAEDLDAQRSARVLPGSASLRG
mmetsp:Transcript_88387/g.249034  ORF Transcript_88387/g.249034 Transcript_88387/m.249034 type:complete len:272 (-) Transcript_88387:1141-1956(-)